MTNVVDFPSLKTPPTDNEKADKFMLTVLDWAESNGVDISDTSFKYDACVIKISLLNILYESK